MGRTVGELLDSLDAAELIHWLALYELDPWTADRADWRAGMICAVVANALTGSKHGPADFTPTFEPLEEFDADAQDRKCLLQGLRWASMLGGLNGE